MVEFEEECHAVRVGGEDSLFLLAGFGCGVGGVHGAVEGLMRAAKIRRQKIKNIQYDGCACSHFPYS